MHQCYEINFSDEISLKSNPKINVMSASTTSVPRSLVEPKGSSIFIDLHTQLPDAAIHQGLLLASSSSSSKSTQEETAPQLEITKDYINKQLYGERAIVLHNILSADECAQLSSLTDQVHMTDASADHRYRNNMRCEIKSLPLAEILLPRVSPFIEHKKVVTSQNLDDVMQRELMIGEWKLCGMNDQFVLCFYLGEQRGHLGPHYDGEHQKSENECSIKTFMIYLNDEYEGGATNFLREEDLHFDEDKGIYCAPPGQIVASLKAKQGDCLIFDHKILHEGAQVLSGKKYIVRSEIMYQRTSEGDELTDAQKQGRTFLAEARKCEELKDFDAAVKFYQKAFKIYPELERLA